MFVLQSKYESLALELRTERAKYKTLIEQWNLLVDKINANGGANLFNRKTANNQFSNSEIKKLISLCHPDKHKGSNAANEITTKLLELRR